MATLRVCALRAQPLQRSQVPWASAAISSAFAAVSRSSSFTEGSPVRWPFDPGCGIQISWRPMGAPLPTASDRADPAVG